MRGCPRRAPTMPHAGGGAPQINAARWRRTGRWRSLWPRTALNEKTGLAPGFFAAVLVVDVDRRTANLDEDLVFTHGKRVTLRLHQTSAPGRGGVTPRREHLKKE